MLAGPGGESSPRLEPEPLSAPRRVRTGAIAVALIAVLLIGLPLAYRMATGSSTGTPSPVAIVSPPALVPSPSDSSPAPTPAPTAPGDVDLALESLQAPGVFVGHKGIDCSVEPIPMVLGRSRRLDGTVEARDHGVWVFTCRHEAGDRNRYFLLASDVTDELANNGAAFQGSTSYVGDPGELLETRWLVSGDVLSGEIELLATAPRSRTLTLVLLVDLRGSWQGEPPTS